MKKALVTVAKYAAAMAFPALAVFRHGNSKRYLLVIGAELCLIAILTEVLCAERRRARTGYLINSLTLLAVNIQAVVLYWGNTYINLAFIKNISSARDLSGKAGIYLLSIFIVLAISSLPVTALGIRRKWLAALLLVPVSLCLVSGGASSRYFSPHYALWRTFRHWLHYSRMQAASADIASITEEFFNDGISDSIKRPDMLSDRPNVILVFTEGLSQNIIEDGRRIMPNALALRDASLSFENYYNHTFATYMGLLGQLFPGYQRRNLDTSALPSLQSILQDAGYRTAFINVEPNNGDFSNYLAALGFDEVLTDSGGMTGAADTVSDRRAYEILFDTAVKMEADDAPFFLAIYTFGTHAGLDSVDEVFGDGTDPLLNKFYNADVQLGKFFRSFQNGVLHDDTILIFTADHATYQEADFISSFPSYRRMSLWCDEIPLYIYFADAEPARYDVGGRNSLGLAPTVLDLLDISGENYFLGRSLFNPDASLCDTIFQSYETYLDTSDAKVRGVEGEKYDAFTPLLTKYFSLKANNMAEFKRFLGKPKVSVRVLENMRMEVHLEDVLDYGKIKVAVWSEANGQDDLRWYAVRNHENRCDIFVDLHDSGEGGLYNIHVYGNAGGKKDVFLGATVRTVEGVWDGF